MRQERTVPLLSVACALLLGALVGSWGWALAAPAQGIAPAAAVGTAFAYQGQLRDGGQPANGSYDFTFTLHDALSGGAQIGAAASRPSVSVSQGFFAVELDFGDVFDGSARYLGIAVRPAGSPEAPTALSPRQSLAPVPYALRAAQPAAPTVEAWRLGDLAFINPSGDNYRGAQAILMGSGFGDLFRRAFPGRPSDVAVRAVRLQVPRVLNPASGPTPYDGALLLDLEVRRISDGQLLRTLLAQPVDLTAQPLLDWLTLTPAGDVTITPSEYLAVVVTGSGTEGSIELGLDLEIAVEVAP